MQDVATLWVYLRTSPLLWLTATLAAYLAAVQLQAWLGRHPLANPVLIAVAVLVLVLRATGTPYAAYFDGAQFVHFMLGPATVALAVPLVAEAGRVRRLLLPMLCAVTAGSATAIVTAVGVAWALGASRSTLLSLAPKSVTTPIAMAIAEQVGGLPNLTAVLVILTGITGAVLVTPLMNGIGLRDYAARGFAAGVASHGIGTARAFQVSPLAGTFAGLGLALNGLVTSVLAPVLIGWMM
ncbi:MAG TPA: LrgB family protein [Crenalkalicoccus sp.]|nr:LrgB family protein [Crenalkalicoccus sp.]